MKRRLVCMFRVAFILFATCAVWLIIPAGPITKANCDRIQTGMTEREVEEILGGPATETHRWPEDADEARIKIWSASDASVLVYFDANGLVYHKNFGLIAPRPIWWRILHWLGFQLPPPSVEA